MSERATIAHHDDAEWVRQVLAEYERPLLRYCVKIVHDVETARDVVQDVFLRLIGQQREEVEDHIVEWLFTVCRNRSLDVLKKERRMTELSDARMHTLAAAGSADGSAEDATEQSARLLSMLDALPPRQQEVIRLKFLGGLSYKEISRVTELTVSNVGFLIHTGIKRIRETMHTDAETRAGTDLGVAQQS